MASTFLIRDGLESDIAACLEINHTYETDTVWQMQIAQEVGRWQVTFKTERLPRTMEVIYSSSEHRLSVSLADDQCFLVAGERDNSEILGYLSMRREPSRRVGWIQDLVVDREYRRAGIGSRLLRVARSWAVEHDLTRLMVETQTKNYPSINFCTATGFSFCGYNDRYLDNQDIAVFFGQSLR
jgi:GNAT superfamily N-acetyltransferase